MQGLRRYGKGCRKRVCYNNALLSVQYRTPYISEAWIHLS